MTPFRVSIVAAIAALLLLFAIFELIRSRRLQERYAMLWLLTGIVILILGLWRGLLSTIADAVGIALLQDADVEIDRGPPAREVARILEHGGHLFSRASDSPSGEEVVLARHWSREASRITQMLWFAQGGIPSILGFSANCPFPPPPPRSILGPQA